VRIVEAFRVLMGQRLTPLQIEAEWAEYQQIFRDLLQQFSASLAREAKAEKKRLDKLVALPEAVPGGPVFDDRAQRKAVLRQKMAQRTMTVASPTVHEESG